VPLTAKGKKIMQEMIDQYGRDKGESMFYAMERSGKLKGVAGKKRKK
jgi:hypothetical protein